MCLTFVEAIGILGQVWYLIVSNPDLCTLSYFSNQSVHCMYIRALPFLMVVGYLQNAFWFMYSIHMVGIASYYLKSYMLLTYKHMRLEITTVCCVVSISNTVWYLIVSIPDLCLPLYFGHYSAT